jgi:heme oxygenase
LNDSSLRAKLRDLTADLHTKLDAEVGAFSDLVQYRNYLRNTHRFRVAMESQALATKGWQSEIVADLVAADLSDLGEPTEKYLPAGAGHESDSATLGRLYVLEGSAVGARLLLRRAERLGLNARFGARHLAHQVTDPTRWPRFIQLLDMAADINPAEAGHAAREAFGLALASYTRAAHD